MFLFWDRFVKPLARCGISFSAVLRAATRGLIVRQLDLLSRFASLLIAFFLGLIALQMYLDRSPRIYADSGRFDYVQVLASPFAYNGNQGVLLLDKRNGNIWFLPKGQDMTKTWFKDPVFLIRAPLEKLEEQPR